MITSDFFILIGIALAIAFPVAWLLATEWLENFAYRINISWLSFGISAVGIVALALLTIFSQTTKAASSNPVDSLRDE